jgi:hypothetical protein
MLTYLRGGGNIFNYQNVPENHIIYRSGSSGFQTIANNNNGVLMNYNNEYKFGIPSAYELVNNYKDNSIVMTLNNQLTTVPVEGTSPNKLLRNIDGVWKIVDFNVKYIKPELYDSNSWQIWIADDEINVINIPKDKLYMYGISYENNQFVLTNLENNDLNEVYIPYNNTTTDFVNVYTNAKIYADTNSNNTDLYTCIFSHNKNEIFNGIIADNIGSITNVGITPDFYINRVYIYCGLLIRNANDYTSNSKFITLAKNEEQEKFQTDTANLRNVFNGISLNNIYITPMEILNNSLGSNFIYNTNFKFYCMIQNDINDTAEYYWYYPRNYINMYLKRA